MNISNCHKVGRDTKKRTCPCLRIFWITVVTIVVVSMIDMGLKVSHIVHYDRIEIVNSLDTRRQRQSNINITQHTRNMNSHDDWVVGYTQPKRFEENLFVEILFGLRLE